MKRWVSWLAVGLAAILIPGCGGGGGSSTGGGGQFIASPNPTPEPVSTRTFTVSNPGNASYTLVTSAVGGNDGDTAIASGSVTASRLSQRTLVMHRDSLQRVTPSRTPSAPVDYDNSPTLPFYISVTNQTVTLYNLTPGVLGNPGTRPNSIVTYVEEPNGVPVIDTADLQNAINAWETSNPFGAPGNDGIYATTRGIFGSEWTNGGGRDGDPRVVCCFLSSATMGNPGLFGYVDYNDELAPRGQSVDGQPSNGGEIIYFQAQPTTVSDFFEGDGFDGYATMVHELQHLIIFNNKVAQQGTFPPDAQPEETTIDEGLSTLAEWDNGFTLQASGGGNSFIFDAILGYETVPTASDNFYVFNDLLQDFGKGFLFFKHIQDTLGLSTITAIDESTGIGSANVATQTHTSFANDLQGWAIANYVSGLSGSTGFTYDDLNMAGTFSLHADNDPADAFTATLTGVPIGATVNSGGTVDTSVAAFSALFLGVTLPSGSQTITTDLPANQEASLVTVENGAVTSVDF